MFLTDLTDIEPLTTLKIKFQLSFDLLNISLSSQSNREVLIMRFIIIIELVQVERHDTLSTVPASIIQSLILSNIAIRRDSYVIVDNRAVREDFNDKSVVTGENDGGERLDLTLASR